MNIEVHFHQMDSSEAIKSHIDKAASRLERFLNNNDALKVVVGSNGHHQVYAEAFIHEHNQKKDFFSREECNQGKELYLLLDKVFDKLYAQIQKARAKQMDQHQKRDPLKKASPEA
jgi:ribosomal subunit interface protein